MGKATEKRRRRRILALALVVVTVAGTGYAATTAAGRGQAESVTLTVSLFGDFGYGDLYKQYEAAHPGVTIKESIQDYLWPLMTAEDLSKTDKKLNLAAPENIMVVAAGGPGLAQSWLLQPHLSCPTSELVTTG